jgi:hypothetical protein
MAVTKSWSNPETATGSGGLDIATGATLTETIWDRMASCLDFKGGSTGTIGVLAANNGTQSIPNSTATALTLGAEYWDTEGMHSTSASTSRVTFAVAGVYLVGASVAWEANATGTRALLIRGDGSTNIAQVTTPANSGSYATVQSLCIPIMATAASYVEALVTQDSGGALNATTGATFADGVLWAVKL